MTVQGLANSRYAVPVPEIREPTYVDGWPLAQWATRWESLERATDGDYVKKSGWVLQKGRNPELDAACTQAGIPSFEYIHASGTGAGAKHTYWHFPRCHVFVLATHIPSEDAMKANLEDRHGLAYAQEQLYTFKSVARFGGVMQELYAVGYTQPCLFVIKGGCTYKGFFPALKDHHRALKMLRELKASKLDVPVDDVPYPVLYEIAVAFTTGDATQVGREKKSTIIPPASALPAHMTREYLIQHYINAPPMTGLLPWLEDADNPEGMSVIDHLREWSVKDTMRIYKTGAEGQSTPGADPSIRSRMTLHAEDENAPEDPAPTADPDEDLPF